MAIELAFGILESSQIRFLIACTETPKHGLHDWHLFRHGRRPLLQTKHNDPPCRLRTGFSFGPPPAGGATAPTRSSSQRSRVRKEEEGLGAGLEEEEEGAAAARKTRRGSRPRGRRGGRRDLKEYKEGKLAAR